MANSLGAVATIHVLVQLYLGPRQQSISHLVMASLTSFDAAGGLYLRSWLELRATPPPSPITSGSPLPLVQALIGNVSSYDASYLVDCFCGMARVSTQYIIGSSECCPPSLCINACQLPFRLVAFSRRLHLRSISARLYLSLSQFVLWSTSQQRPRHHCTEA